MLLFVRLENERIVVHDEADNEEQRRAKANKPTFDLMRYFSRPTIGRTHLP